MLGRRCSEAQVADSEDRVAMLQDEEDEEEEEEEVEVWGMNKEALTTCVLIGG